MPFLLIVNATSVPSPGSLTIVADPPCLRILPTIEQGVLRTIEVPAESGLGAEMEVATEVDAVAVRRAVVERLARL